MTPLAHELAKQLILPHRDRDPFWDAEADALRHVLDDTHFFETSAVEAMLPELGDALGRAGSESFNAMLDNHLFLPAPKTWIEFKPHKRDYRLGLFLEEGEEEGRINVTMLSISFMGECVSFIPGCTDVIYKFNDETPWFRGLYSGDEHIDARQLGYQVLGCVMVHLLMINSPKVIGRRQHTPHRGMERKLTRVMGGKMFPMHGWTEIKLQVNKPPEIDDGEPHEAHITGRRALHFCRKHIRIKRGRLEYVSAHWRGDASLGIVRSRYTVTP